MRCAISSVAVTSVVVCLVGVSKAGCAMWSVSGQRAWLFVSVVFREATVEWLLVAVGVVSLTEPSGVSDLTLKACLITVITVILKGKTFTLCKQPFHVHRLILELLCIYSK